MTKHYIVGKDVVVDFPVYENSHRSLKKVFLRAATGGRLAEDSGRHLVVRALDGLNFRFEDGDRVGLIGHNGSGKTTLLRVLAGIYEPTGGSLVVKGRIAALLDVTMGLDPDATGFENIYLRGLIAGLKPREIRNRVSDIEEFCELGDYLNLPVRTYSSGMMLRLAFAVSTSFKADILIMDEWLSVGDAEFSAKASQRLNGVVESASILVLASHNTALVERTCNRIFKLEHGRIIEATELQSVAVNDALTEAG